MRRIHFSQYKAPSATLGDRVAQTIKIWNVVIQTDRVGYLDSLLIMWCMYGGDLRNYNMLNQQRKLSHTTFNGLLVVRLGGGGYMLLSRTSGGPNHTDR